MCSPVKDPLIQACHRRLISPTSISCRTNRNTFGKRRNTSWRKMAGNNPRKFKDRIALLNQKQAESTEQFEVSFVIFLSSSKSKADYRFLSYCSLSLFNSVVSLSFLPSLQVVSNFNWKAFKANLKYPSFIMIYIWFYIVVENYENYLRFIKSKLKLCMNLFPWIKCVAIFERSGGRNLNWFSKSFFFYLTPQMMWI